MKVSKRILAVLLSVLLLLPSFATVFAVAEGEEEIPTVAYPNADPDEPYYVVGWLQGEGDEVTGTSEVQVNEGEDAATYPNKVTTGDFTYRVSEHGEEPVSIEGFNAADLALVVDVTYTRTDGTTGDASLRDSQNQLLWLYGVNEEGAGVSALEFTGAPYLTAMTSGYANAAGTTVTYTIPFSYTFNGNAALKNDVVSIDSFRWFVYNDSWKVDLNGNGAFDDAYGFSATFANARIIDTTRDGEGYKHGIVATWADVEEKTQEGTTSNFVAHMQWTAPQTKAMTAEMSAANMTFEFDILLEDTGIEAQSVKNGQVRFFATTPDGGTAEYNKDSWANGKFTGVGEWMHFEYNLTEFYRNVDGVKTYDLIPANIERCHIFNYNDNARLEGNVCKVVSTKMKNIRIVDSSVTAPRKNLAAAVAELKEAIFDENDAAVAYDAAVAAGEALLADRDATNDAINAAIEAIATAKAALTNVVDMKEDVLSFPGHGYTKKTAEIGRAQYYFNWITAAEATGTTGGNLTDGGTDVGANRYFQVTLTLTKNAAYTGDVVVEDLSALLKQVEVRVRTNIGSEKRTNSYFLEEVGGLGDENSITLTMEGLLTAEAQNEVEWNCVRDAIIFVQLNQDLRADGSEAQADIPVYCTLDDVKIVNKTAAVLKEDLAEAADEAVDGYEENDALTAYTTAQAAAKALLEGDATVRELKAAAAELATLKEALTEKVEPTPVDRTALNEAIAAGEAALADETKDYTVDTETALQAAIDAGKAVAEDADQATVDAAAKAITDAIDALEEVIPEPTVDKAALGALLAEVEGAAGEADKYTEDTVAALNAAYAAAKAVYDNADATQDDVNAQVTALQAAIDGLELKPVAPNRAALDKAIADAEAMLAIGNYTADTKAAVDEALAAAKAVAEDADQETIDAAAAALNEAVAALVVDPIQYVEIPMKEKDENGVITSTETHGLSVYGALTYKDENDVDQYAPIDLTPYVGCDLSIVFKMKLNVTENLPEALADVDPAEWIKYIRNGSAILYTGYLPDQIKWASGEGGNPYKLICGEAGNLAEDVNFDEFVEIEIPVPQVIIDGGALTDFWILMYNDLHALVGGTAEVEGSQGVTLSVKDVFIKVDATNKVDKTTLQAAINAMLTDDQLVGYTAGSIAKYKALYAAAQAVLDDEAATAEQVVAQVNVLKNAAGVLVEDMSDGGTIALVEGEMNSAVAHYLSVNKTFESPYNFAKYGERESIKLSFDIRVNKDEATFPEVLGDITDAEWLPYIVNGSIILWTEGTTDDYKFTLNQQTPPIVLNCTKVGDLLETAIVGVYSNVTIDLPAEIVAAGTISKIEIYLYNDMNNLNAEAGNSNGVSISVKDINLIMGAQVEVDKTELQAAIDAEVTDFEGFTEESVAAYQAALAAAKEVLADEAATKAQVAKALADLAAAVLVPEASYSIGNVDGSADGKVSANDALVALQIATGKLTASADQLAAANVNGSVDDTGAATVTAEDALLILQYATQKITSFPVAKA